MSAAVLLMRAAHGRPRAVSVRQVVDTTAKDPDEAGRLAEADASVRSLTWGVVLSFVCTALLCAVVGLAWYGPAEDKPRIEVRLVNGAVQCGEVVSTASAQLVLKTAQGQVAIEKARDARRTGDPGSLDEAISVLQRARTNRWQRSFQPSLNRPIAEIGSLTLPPLLRRMACRVMIEKKLSGGER